MNSSGRHISVWTASAFVVASMIGTGVFTSLGFQLKDIQSVFPLMMLWIVGAVIGILVIVVLIYKYTRTSKYDTVGFSMYCRVCGDKINGLKCPKCTQKKYDLR